MTSLGPEEEAAVDEPAGGIIFKTLRSALNAARGKLLDRSLRNKLIHTNVASTKARQVRVIDEQSVEIFSLLRSGKSMSFSPGLPSRTGDESDDEGLYIPVAEQLDAEGRAPRHRDLKLQTRLTPEGLQRKLLSLYHESQTLEEEQGVNILYLALGFLQWREAKRSEVDRFAPLVLLPVELLRDGARDRFKLKLRPDDLFTNISMQAWLKEQFGIDLPELSDTEDLSISGYFDEVRKAIGNREGWSVDGDEILLGFFSFSKFLLWRDLDPANWPNAETFLGHPLLTRILVREEEEDDEPPNPLIGDDEILDEVFKPKNLVHITDADSSQAIAIEEALSGRDLVIQGPPGTGKSQTITNIIAGAIQRGKSVLFIAEKMAALEVVHSRLSKAKLEPVCLELHSRKASKTAFLEQIKKAMSAAVPPAWPSAVFDQLEESQAQLRAHSTRLHKAGPNGRSPFQLFGRISLLKGEGTPTPDFDLPGAQDWSQEQLDQNAERCDRLADRLAVAGTPNAHPWRGVGIPAPDLLQQDRLRPVINSLRDELSKATDLEEKVRDLLELTEPLRFADFATAARALAHLSDRPSLSAKFLSSQDVANQRSQILDLLAKGERLAKLRSRATGYREVFDHLSQAESDDALRQAWSHLSSRPAAFDLYLLSEPIVERHEKLSALVDAGERFYALDGELEGKVIAAAFEEDWLPIRRAVAANGKSWFRWLSREYRQAVKSLSSVAQQGMVTTFEDRLSLLDLLLERTKLEADLKSSVEDAQLLGALWKEGKSNWSNLREILNWVALAEAFAPDLQIRTQQLFAASDASSPWPTAFSEQLEVLAVVREAIQLEINIEAASDARAALGELWRSDLSDWESIREGLAWIEGALEFEPKFALRSEGVLVRADEGGELGKQLSEADAATRQASQAVVSDFQINVPESAASGGLDARTPIDALSIAQTWVTEFDRVTEWPAIRDDLSWLNSIGCQALAERVFVGRIGPSLVTSTLLIAASETMWRRLRAEVPELEKTLGDELHRLVAKFRSADLDRIRIASDEVKRAHLDRCPTGSAGAVGLLKDETRKSRRLKPVRKMMEEAGEAVQRFKPVYLMSPLSVAQFLPPGRLKFDLCVIDEASQVRPEDALGAIARCAQLVVVGDDKQLPPTNFFNRMVSDGDDEEEDLDGTSDGSRAAAVKDIESILNLCSRFPERMLRWHYRSEHPALIATSNRKFYKGQLMLPPSVIAGAGDGETGLVFHKVAEGGYERGRSARNELEAEDVAQAVLKHAKKYPDLSLGIGTFSVAQRDAIRDRLDALAAKHPNLDAFLQKGVRDEKVFVKNLENIQGDERDVIFISVGYGRDRDGRLTQQFGPIGRDGGERRLNVLITRARKRCEVFSSLVAEDIKTDGVPKPGVDALREFLKLAKDGFADLPHATERGFDSEFEEAVASAVQSLGYDVHPQVGMAGFFVDLGVVDPRDSNRYLLGIECDGAAYHSSRYARDRDRLRQQILESRGWRMHRIWSTDWFYRQEREIDKIKAALQAALSNASARNSYEVENDSWASATPGPAPVQSAMFDSEAAGAGFAFYELYGELAPELNRMQPHELSTARLAEVVTEIVRVEQPIHQDEVGRRLASAFGLQKSGRRIQEAALRGLQRAENLGDLRSRGQFWRLPETTGVRPRDRSRLPSASTVRKVDSICPTELAAAMTEVLRQSLALETQDLITECARALGFARTGGDISTAIRSALQNELRDSIRVDHLNRIELIN